MSAFSPADIQNTLNDFADGNHSRRVNVSGGDEASLSLGMAINKILDSYEEEYQNKIALEQQLSQTGQKYFWQEEELKARNEEYEVYSEVLLKQKRDLEQNSSELARINCLLKDEAEQRQKTESEKEVIYRNLIEVSRQAGVAEVSTSVIHNVGNVLNSINISTENILETLSVSRIKRLLEAIHLMKQHEGDIGEFLTKDEKGKILLPYLEQVSVLIANEYNKIKNEL